MQLSTKIVLLISAISLAGCASTPSKPAQFNAQGGGISVSPDPISSMTESGGGDYFVPNSQITVGGARNATNNKAASMFGLIGVGIAMSIDKTSNNSAISKSGLDKPIKFDDLVNGKITKAIDDGKFGTYRLSKTAQPQNIDVKPYARIALNDRQKSIVTFGYRVNFKNALNNKDSKRFYNFIAKNKYPLSGENSWDANNNQLFNDTANKAFDALTEVLALDTQNKLDFYQFNADKQKECQTDETQNLKFITSPESLCIGVFQLKNSVMSQSISVIEK